MPSASCPECGWCGLAAFELDDGEIYDPPGACPECGGQLVAADLEETRGD